MHEMHQLPLRSLLCAYRDRIVARNGLMSGIRHNPRGVQHRLQNISAALRMRDYRVGSERVPN